MIFKFTMISSENNIMTPTSVKARNIFFNDFSLLLRILRLMFGTGKT